MNPGPPELVLLMYELDRNVLTVSFLLSGHFSGIIIPRSRPLPHIIIILMQ
jgi:hypothetical protein